MSRDVVLTTLVALAVSWSGSGGALCDEPSAESSLRELVTPAEERFLLAELARVDPPERLLELATYGERQSALGGGFYGMLPDPLADAERIPVPRDAAGRQEAALHLARCRRESRAALAKLNPDYATEFAGASLSDFLAEGAARDAGVESRDAELSLELDLTVIRGFFDAWSDGEVTAEEAAGLASLPSNRAMLEHRRDLGYVPEPLPDRESLAGLIRMAGSTDPLDRLWCWTSSQNAFDYADLFQHPDEYLELLGQLDEDGQDLVSAALEQIARYTPAGTEFHATFAFTVGWAIRGWTTPAMAGLNVEQVKDDWSFLFGTLVEETYHRLQLQLFPSASESAARIFEDLIAIESGDESLDRLYEIVAYTIAEGAANFARGRFVDPEIAAQASEGAELMKRFVREVVENGDPKAADAILNEGLQSNGPLYGLGWQLAALIAGAEGDRAVGDWQRRGPTEFFLHAAQLGTAKGGLALDPSVIEAVRDLNSTF